eukprot:SAG31_NODE_17433_length_670_cov_5.658494_1_plen_40_part_01
MQHRRCATTKNPRGFAKEVENLVTMVEHSPGVLPCERYSM